jgi:hypothetical protein
LRSVEEMRQQVPFASASSADCPFMFGAWFSLSF